MSYENPRQIVKYQTADKVLEFNDQLAMAPVELAGNLHARYSKVHIVVVDTSNGKGQDAVVTTANIDPVKIKRLYEKVQDIKHDEGQSESRAGGVKENRIGIGDYRNMTPTEALKKHGDEAVKKLEDLIPVFEKNKDKYPINAKKIEEIKEAIVAYKSGTLKSVEDAPAIKTIFYERKINPNERRKNENGEFPVTTLQIDYNPRMNNCWTVIMENGWGQTDTRANGGIFIKRGSYRPEKETKVVVGDEPFREMIRQTNDYIFQKEILFMSRLEKQLAAYEEEKRKEWAKE
jgi:CRISPR/Cas system CSM-associated protein Csm2 small subunit